MFGIDDPAIFTGYLLAIISLIACVIYGVLHWNKGKVESEDELQKDLAWEEEDDIQRDI